MKKIHFLLVALSIISLMSCEDMLDLGIEVKSDEVTVDFEITPTDYLGDTTLAVSAVESDFEGALEEAGVSPEDVTSVKLKSATIEILNEDEGITFDFFETVEAAIKVDGLDELTIASVDSIPQGAKILNCDVASSELMDYVSASEYLVLAKGNVVEPINETIQIKGTLIFSIKTSMGLEME